MDAISEEGIDKRGVEHVKNMFVDEISILSIYFRQDTYCF